MAQQLINIGTVANDGAGDNGRVSFDKVNDNFTELYSITSKSATALQSDGSIDGTDQLFAGHVGIGANAAVQTGRIIDIKDTITSPTGGAYGEFIDLNLEGNGNATNHYAEQFSITVDADTAFTGIVGAANYAPVIASDVTTFIGARSLVATAGGIATVGKVFDGSAIILTGTIETFYGIYHSDVNVIAGTAPVNSYAAYFEKTASASGNNYGIVLDGDDLGADIAFGATQQFRMHHDGTNWTIEGSGVAYSTVGAPLTNAGWIPIDINGTVYKIMLAA